MRLWRRKSSGKCFFLRCFIPSRCENGSEAHPTRVPKFTAPAETQEASGADLPAHFCSAFNPHVRRRICSYPPRMTFKNPRHFLCFCKQTDFSRWTTRVDVVGAKIALRLDTRRCASLRRTIDKFLNRSMVVASTGQSRRQFGRGDRVAARWMLWLLTPDRHGDRACLEPQQLPASRLYA